MAVEKIIWISAEYWTDYSDTKNKPKAKTFWFSIKYEMATMEDEAGEYENIYKSWVASNEIFIDNVEIAGN